MFAGSRLTNTLSLDLLIEYGGPTRLAKAGPAKVKAWARKTKHRGVDALVDDPVAALIRQSVTVIGTAAVESVIPASLSRSPRSGPNEPSSLSKSRGCSMASFFATS